MTIKKNSNKNVILSIENLPDEIVSYLKENYQFYDLSKDLSNYKTIKTYSKNLRNKWNKILNSISKFPDPNVVIFRTYVVVDRNLIDIFPENILFLRAGSGYDNIDIKYAKNRNCKIENTPLANTNSAFEHTIALLFSSLKKINQFNFSVKNGNWRDDLRLNTEAKNKNILIVGYGNIGHNVANFAKFIGMNIYIFDPIKSLIGKYDFLPDFKPISNDFELNFNFNYDDLYEISKYMDIITFHIPLYDLTYKIIDKKFLQNLKENSLLINTSRGELFEPNDLLDFYNKNKDRFLATDVLPEEPCYGESEFFKLENCLITPHIGAYTYESRERLKNELIKCIEAYFNEKKILYQINENFYFSPYFYY